MNYPRSVRRCIGDAVCNYNEVFVSLQTVVESFAVPFPKIGIVSALTGLFRAMNGKKVLDPHFIYRNGSQNYVPLENASQRLVFYGDEVND